VPSFEQVFPASLQQEAEYWSRWYRFVWDQGYLGFFDLRVPRAPLIMEGVEVLDPSSLHHTDSAGTHAWIDDHPLIRGAEFLLDIGCGTGWSSLFFARRGHKVVGFDPSASNMQLAKRYALSQGEYIEYLAAGLGYVAFQPDQFDAIVTLHSLHHVPSLAEEMKGVRSWLRAGGGIAIDEHIYTDPLLSALAEEMHRWARTDVYPAVRSIDIERLKQALPASEPSALEDAGSEDVISSFLQNFALESHTTRCVSLDYFSFIYYLSRDLNRMLFQQVDSRLLGHTGGKVQPNLDVRGFHYAADVLNRLYTLLLKAYPDSAEYVTLVGSKSTAHHGSEEPTRHNQQLQASGRERDRLRGDRLPKVAQTADTTLRLSVDESEEMPQQAPPENESPIQAAVASLQGDVERLNDAIHAKNSYIEELELTLHRKNKHIERLEGLARAGNKSDVAGHSPLSALRRFFKRKRKR
jgi:SAM-dependent methyltransferase